MTRTSLNVLVGMLLISCSRSQPAQVEPTTQPSVTIVQPQAARPSPNNAETIEISRDGASITIKGSDRWGVPFTTTYENETYLANALPTLERGLTAAQVLKLKQELTPGEH